MKEARSGLFGGAINGKLYVAGGGNESVGALSSTEAYDPAADQWTVKASMRCDQNAGGSAVTGGKLFVIGGADCNAAGLTRNLQIYAP